MKTINRYMIVFPSVSKAGYAQDKLREAGYFTTVKKSPAGLLKTCGYAVYLDVKNIDNAISVLDGAGIAHNGVYWIQQGEYRKLR